MAIMVYRDKNTLWAAKIHFFNTGNTLLLLWGLAGLHELPRDVKSDF